MPPIPKRSSERRRRNVDSRPDHAAAGEVDPPPAAEHWHELAADWYRSLQRSGQSVFYEQSYWETARIWAELLSRQLESGRVSAQMIQAWQTAAGELLTTEGARRKARLELDRAEESDEVPAEVAAIDEYRKIVGG